MSRPLLKQFGDLRPADFKGYPIWVSVHSLDCDEEWYDETDEETFRPWLGERPVGAEEMFLVNARFTFADGTECDGFVTPTASRDGLRNMGSIQPQVFSPAGERFAFWFGMFESSDKIERFYRSFAKSSSQVFPIRFQPQLGLTSAVASGEIPGFMSIPRGEQVKITI
jgi:hypothetical protein